ncbi:MAG: phosphoglycolate phosphatase [Nitrospirae bacterium]|nr:phosphoglycolate phosphatase [Nitrospirota bacterium]
MQWPIDLLIFDLDGTLVDSRQDIFNAVNRMLDQLALDPLPPETIVGYVGNGVRELIHRSLGPAHLDRLKEGMAHFLDHYSAHLLDKTHLYPGVTETLEALAGKRMAVVSNKLEDLSRRILQGLGVAQHFALVVGGDTVGRKKPSPEAIRWVLTRLGVLPDRTMIVGDSPTDIEAGRAAGIRTCGVTYGFRPPELVRAARPDLVIDDLRALRDHVV